MKLISEFLLKGQDIIHCMGGVLILVMGIGLLLKKGSGGVKEVETSDYLPMFFSHWRWGLPIQQLFSPFFGLFLVWDSRRDRADRGDFVGRRCVSQHFYLVGNFDRRNRSAQEKGKTNRSYQAE